MDQPWRDRTAAFVLRVCAGCVLAAGLVALWAVANGDFDRTDGRLIATSVAFGIFSAFAASGAALAGGPGGGWRRPLGAAGVVASVTGFVLLSAALWTPHADDALWRWAAIAGLVALWCWHAGAILGSRRDDDGTALVVASTLAVCALGLDSLGAIAAIAHWLERPRDPALVRAFTTALVVAVVASVLVPLLRRLELTSGPAPADVVAASARVAAHVPARRGPSETLSASWSEGDPLTRVVLGTCAVAPILAVLALALAWPASRAPASARTITVAAPPVTVTQVPPAPVPADPATGAPDARSSGEGFTAADATRIIVRRRRSFDRQAARSASALAPIVERCYARAEDFTECDTAAELPAAAAAGLSLGMGQAQVAVVASTVTTYEIGAQSRTGATFTLARDATGALRRTCSPAGAGGCLRDGTW